MPSTPGDAAPVPPGADVPADPASGGTGRADEAPAGATGSDGPTGETGAATAGGADADRRPTRRRVLRTLVNGGAALGIGATVEGLGVLRADGEATITYALVHDDGGAQSGLRPLTTTVPARWYDGLRRSFALRADLVDLDLGGLRDVFVVPGPFDAPGPRLSLTVADAGVRDQVVDSLGDLDVDLDVSVLEDLPELVRSQPSTDQVTLPSRSHDDVPGGVVCGTDDGARGSLAPACYDAEGRRWFATANHVFGEGGSQRREHAGETLFVVTDDGARRVGVVRRGYPAVDVVRAGPVGDARPTSHIHGVGAVGGQFTRFGLALLRARGRRLRKVGGFSGRTRGHIEGIDGVTCYAGIVCKRGQLKWGDESVIVDGDSGSVNYHPDPGDPDTVLVGGFNNARTWWPGANFAWGTAAHHLTRVHGLHF